MFHFEDDYRPAAAELASEADKLWFKPHPSRRPRLRQALAGERPGVTAEHWVVLRQSFRGLRLRWTFLSETPLPPGDAPEWMARGLFEAIARERGFLTNVFEEVIGASPVVMESLRRAADGQDT